MKKFFVILMTLVMCMACMGFANAEKAGDVVTIPIKLSTSDAVFVKVSVSYDTNAFELVSFDSEGTKNGTTFVWSKLEGLPSGQCATIKLRVTDNAVPGQTYNITASVKEAWTYDETQASASATGGSVTIDKPVEPTDEPTEEPTDEPTVEPTDKPTEEPTDEPTVEPTDKPTEEPTVKPTDKPTDEPSDEPTKAPVEEEEDDDDVPKTSDNSVSYTIAAVAMMLALVWLVSRRFAHSK